MANRQKTVYCCSECGAETSNWAGKCPSCGAWNTLTEVKLELGAGNRSAPRSKSLTKPKKLSELDVSAEIRFSTGISEFDRVLGGGAVIGSLVLVGGAPGIGKSTLLLQMCGSAVECTEFGYMYRQTAELFIRIDDIPCVLQSTYPHIRVFEL